MSTPMSSQDASTSVTVELAPNEILVRIPVVVETESDWELGYSAEYVTGSNFEIVAETLDDRTAALLSYELEGGDLFPDGLTDLSRRLAPMVEHRRSVEEQAHRDRNGF